MKTRSKLVLVLISGCIFLGVGAARGSNEYSVNAVGRTPDVLPRPLDSGGPDAYGYYFIDSGDSALNAPVYNWVEIESYGTPIAFNSDDQNLGPFSIGFTFNFYGVDFISFRACTNGFASFTSTSTDYSNDPIPTNLEPNNLLAVFWDDFIYTDSGSAYYYTNNTDTLIVEWKNAPYFDDSGVATFQMILTADGNILYQYGLLAGTHNSHTIGIENQDGTVGLQYVYNTDRDETGSAVLFSLTPPDYGALHILVVAADEATLFISEMTSYPDIESADYFDARTGTPTLSFMQGYDAVVVWSNFVFQDPVGMGDVLADFVEAGGAVVLYQFDFGSSWNMQGRLMSEYCPFTVGPTSYTTKNLGIYDAGHSIMAGVSSLSDLFSAAVTLQNSPVLVASYGDGTPLVAYNPINNLVAINAYVGDQRQFTGDMAQLSRNAIHFAADGPGDVLFVMADDGASAAKRAIDAYPDIQGVHLYDPRSATPALSYLSLYDAVVVWSNYRFDDSQTLGNRLADYVDAGGAVVMMQFCFNNNFAMRGRLMSSYSPFDSSTTQYQTRTLGSYVPGHYLMNGVNDISDYYAANVVERNGMAHVASWDDSTPFVAYNPANGVVAINGYIGYYYRYTGDMMVLVHNAINFARGYTGIGDDSAELPGKFDLAQNYPNPFNPTTTLAFDLPQRTNARLEIYNVLGQRVATVFDTEMEAGHHTANFDAKGLGSGIYFYKLTAGNEQKTRKMIVLK